MSHKLYRMCLLSVIILAIVGGIFYYLNYVQDETDITEGTLVQHCGNNDVLVQHSDLYREGPQYSGEQPL